VNYRTGVAQTGVKLGHEPRSAPRTASSTPQAAHRKQHTASSTPHCEHSEGFAKAHESMSAGEAFFAFVRSAGAGGALKNAGALLQSAHAAMRCGCTPAA
jgi:hypothetical protein